MRSTIMALTAAASLSFVAAGAQAMPGQVTAAPAATSPHITLVAEGCGPGLVRGAAGGCRRPGAAVVVGRPAAVVVGRPAAVVRRPGVVVRRPGCGVRVGPVGVRTPC